MSGEWKSHWPLRGGRKWDKMNKKINPFLLKIIPSLLPGAVSEVASSKSHNKSPHHRSWLDKKGTSCHAMLNLRILIMLHKVHRNILFTFEQRSWAPKRVDSLLVLLCNIHVHEGWWDGSVLGPFLGYNHTCDLLCFCVVFNLFPKL